MLFMKGMHFEGKLLLTAAIGFTNISTYWANVVTAVIEINKSED